MNAIGTWLAGKKLYITAIVTILSAVLSMVHVEIPGVPVVDHSTAVQMILTSVMAIFGRQAIAKVQSATGVPK